MAHDHPCAHRPRDADERAALAALQRASFRILRVEAADPQGGHQLLDLAAGARLRLLDPNFPPGCERLAIAARIAPVAGDVVVTVGPVTPLDDAALDVARARMRADGKGLTNPNRCAEAVYKHVVRFGAPEVPGLNRPPEGELWGFPFSPEDGPGHALAFAWSEKADVEPSAGELQAVRAHVGEQDLLETLSGCVVRPGRWRPRPWRPPTSGC
jgi:hypothetical protein